LAAGEGETLNTLDLSQLEAIYQRVKRMESDRNRGE